MLFIPFILYTRERGLEREAGANTGVVALREDVIVAAVEVVHGLQDSIAAAHRPDPHLQRGLAKNLLSSGFIDMISLSKDVSIVEIDVKKEWCGKNLIELNLRKKYGFNIVAIKKGENINANITPEQVLDAETTLIVIANTSKLGKLK